MRGSFRPVLTSAVAASLAWLIAEWFGHDTPIFAPIAAWICLGFKVDRVPRRVAELGVGATVGVLIGELASHVLATGWWQIGLVLLVSALFGRFIDRGEMTVMQAGVNGIVIMGMSWWNAQLGGVQGRWVEALIGAGIAFIIAVLLPRHPTSRPRRYAGVTLDALADMLDHLGKGLQTGDIERLREVKAERRTLIEVATDWEQSLSTAREVVALNPSLWRDRTEVEELSRIFRLLRRNRRVVLLLERQALGMAEESGAQPAVGALVSDAGRACHALAGSVRSLSQPVHAREILEETAAAAAPSRVRSGDWRTVALMAVVRSLVVDLLQVSGLSREQARAALADSLGAEHGEGELGAEDSDDSASDLWG